MIIREQERINPHMLPINMLTYIYGVENFLSSVCDCEFHLKPFNRSGPISTAGGSHSIGGVIPLVSSFLVP